MSASRLSASVTRLITVVSLAALVACTSMQTIAERGGTPLSASQLGQVIARNDSLFVTEIDGKAVQMHLTAVLPNAIEGTVDSSGQVIRLELDQIRTIQRRGFDGTKTTILVVAIVGGVYLLIQAAGAATAVSFIG